jgi:hypothetical protein
MFKVAQARMKLRPAVVEAVTALRTHEQRAFETFNSDEKVMLTNSVRGMHGIHHAPHVDDIVNFNRIAPKKVRSADDWLNDCVNKICRSAVECEGDKPPRNEMVDNVYNILKKYFLSIQLCERSHHITSRNLQVG